MDSPELWRWIWIAVAAGSLVGETAAAGTFFLLPFAVGAFLAAVAAFAGVPLVGELAIFAVGSAVSLIALRPVARRLDADHSVAGIGSRRLVDAPASVIVAIPGGRQKGRIKVQGEEWRAEHIDGTAVPVGAEVTVVDVRGTTALVYHRASLTSTTDPPTEPDSES